MNVCDCIIVANWSSELYPGHPSYFSLWIVYSHYVGILENVNIRLKKKVTMKRILHIRNSCLGTIKGKLSFHTVSEKKYVTLWWWSIPRSRAHLLNEGCPDNDHQTTCIFQIDAVVTPHLVELVYCPTPPASLLPPWYFLGYLETYSRQVSIGPRPGHGLPTSITQ